MHRSQPQPQPQLKNEVAIFYETHVHKKFLADVYAVIPKGRKCVLWFTTNKQCWMFQIAKRSLHDETRNVSYDAARMIKMPFVNDAWYAGQQGTILYGTCVSEKRTDVQRRFSVENVYYLCGEKQADNGNLGRFAALFDAYAKESKAGHQFQLFMPIMHANYNDALRDATAITTYDVYCIQHRFLNRACSEFKNVFIQPMQPMPTQRPMPTQQQKQSNQSTPLFFPKQANLTDEKVKPRSFAPKSRVFTIRPDIQNDIYYVLHNPDETITANTMIAHIPNYKTSVMMNALFRNIKENRNLDALEESDDENEADTPLVNLEKTMQMECVFSYRFKRWQPVGMQLV